jgi:signal transduction histidine kinase
VNRERLKTKIATLCVFLVAVGAVRTTVNHFLGNPFSIGGLLLDFNFQFDILVLVIFLALLFWRHRFAQWALALIVFSSSGIVILTNPSSSYFGLGTIVVGTVLLQRFGMLEKHFALKISAIIIWTFGFIYLSDNFVFHVNIATSLSTFTFVAVNVVVLYFLFEEEIRELLVLNRQKDVFLADQAAEIARLEPLSVLGERVAHVAHSFKNNLNQVSTALFLLEQAHDERAAADKLREFSSTLTERIENILMISRAGVDLEPEVFDAARLLEGLKEVYLTERSFVERTKTELTLAGPTYLETVRWDFILMVENILKNALEAITARGVFGTIRISLAETKLTLANDGGAMATCMNCHESCLNCPQFGRPGQTTKKNGSGHGLAQVMATCRKNGWSFRIRTHEDWTTFEIGLKSP